MSGRTAAIVVVGMIVVGVVVSYYLHLVHNRFYIVAGERGVAYEVDRRTGVTWVLLGGKKEVHAEPSGSTSAAWQAIPYADLSKITGNASLGTDFFHGDIYNGSSSWTVKRLVFRVTAKDKGGGVRWEREVAEDVNICPLSTESFYAKVAGARDADLGGWSIARADGIRRE